MHVLPFDAYVSSFGRLTSHVDPTAASAGAADIKAAAESLGDLQDINVETLASWIHANSNWVPVLGLAVGLGLEKLRNSLRFQAHRRRPRNRADGRRQVATSAGASRH
jgi:hypothetical protein